MTALFVFRRDLRLQDNTALLAALNWARATGSVVVPVFIFDPRQVQKNQLKNPRCINFMIHSLISLNSGLRKYGSSIRICEGDPAVVLRDLHREYGYLRVYVNTDYTPFARSRDQSMKKICCELGAEFVVSHDVLLLGEPTPKRYLKFTPFYDKYRTHVIPKPVPFTVGLGRYLAHGHHTIRAVLAKYYDSAFKLVRQGGRESALQIFRKLTTHSDQYREGGTELSAHNKFGTVSIREVYWAFRRMSDRVASTHLIRQLFWRDFYYNIMNSDPRALAGPFDGKRYKWRDDRVGFRRWCEGRTGIPIIDEAMQTLNRTGYITNRQRLYVSDYLVRHLNINWQWGERYFARILVDYDPAQNNYNWQWIASTGPFARPPFRKFTVYLSSANTK